MKMSGVFSTHLKAEELGPKKRINVTIDRVEMEKVGDDTKPVLYFVGKEKGLALNKTNTNALIEILGSDESDDWMGRTVTLYTTMVDYQGKRVLAIRIDEPTVPAAKAKPTATREPGSDDDSDDVGF